MWPTNSTYRRNRTIKTVCPAAGPAPDGRVDFYLLHGVTDKLISDYLDHGAPEYFREQKRLGKIRYFGFSFHGSPDALRQMLARGPWDFVQIQLNYYDWFHGTARALYEIPREHDIPIMVMEPAHGGMLADLPEAGRNLLLTAKPGATAASWAFRSFGRCRGSPWF
mgnify:CR=1 FL=1